MPDAYGNLLGIEEFTEGLRVRLISYLNPNVVVGFCTAGIGSAPPGFEQGPYLAVNARSDNESWSIFTIRRRQPRWSDVANAFALETSYILNGNPGLLGWFDDRLQMVTAEDWRGSLVCTVDMLDGGCWFAFNNQDRSRVLDVPHGKTDKGTALIAFKWNGGDNQRWRAEIVR